VVPVSAGQGARIITVLVEAPAPGATVGLGGIVTVE
jgi:hypothetical protein